MYNNWTAVLYSPQVVASQVASIVDFNSTNEAAVHVMDACCAAWKVTVEGHGGTSDVNIVASEYIL